MTSSNIKLNTIPGEPTLNDLLNLLKKETLLDLNCHHLATVQSFDSSKQTVTATINYTKTFFNFDEETGIYNPVQLNYPLLTSVPVLILGGGGAHLTMPIAKGDQCLILFNDRDLDNWFQSGQVGPVATSRLHSFSDGIALVGLNSLNTLISDYDSSRAVLRKGNAGVGVSSSKVKIFNNQIGSLGPNFTAFFTALNTFISACTGSSTDPVLAAAAAAFQAALAVPIAPSAQGPIENIEGILE